MFQSKWNNFTALDLSNLKISASQKSDIHNELKTISEFKLKTQEDLNTKWVETSFSNPK